MIDVLVALLLHLPPKPHCEVRGEAPHTNTDVELPPVIGVYPGKRNTGSNHIKIPVNEAHVNCM